MFQPQKGKERAQIYLDLLHHEYAQSTMSKYLILYALLTHKGSELRRAVCDAMGFSTENKLEDIANATQYLKETILKETIRDSYEFQQKDDWGVFVKNVIKPIHEGIDNKEPVKSDAYFYALFFLSFRLKLTDPSNKP
ncbi:MAG: hypothetical protein P4M12_12205 [Gammaproteobacteria bacterium]|nr:hypothetical protein [Gammaproteobacteria bacterium]